MVNLAIRTDASGEIGTGHVMRCLTLANELARRGARITFICREITPTLRQMVQQAGHAVVLLPPAPPDDLPNDGPVHAAWLKAHWRTDADHTLEALREMGGANWLIVDHYALDARWEERQRAQARRIMVIDDLADRPHDCDLLLDVTLCRTREDYAGLVPDDAQLLLGPRYALLRPEFLRLRPSALQRRKAGGPVRRILVSFGGADPDGLSATALRAIAEVAPAEVQVDVALGATPPEELGLPAIAADMPQKVVFHDFSANMAQLMHDADLAIGAGGQSTWERCCLGLSSIVVCTAENQHENAATVQREGAALITDANSVASALCQLLSEDVRRDMALAALRLCHGDGAWLAGTLLHPWPLPGTNFLSLIAAGLEHAELIYRWQCQPGSRRYSRNPHPPTPDEHLQWMQTVLHDAARMLWILMVNGSPAGILRLDMIKNEPDIAEVSILIAEEWRGHGVGKCALQALNGRFSHLHLNAWIHQDNAASLHLFQRAGYQQRSMPNEAGFVLLIRAVS